MSPLQERLQSFHPFDGDIVESIERAAHNQRNHSFRELADQYGLADGAQESRLLGHRLSYLHIPAPEADSAEARVYYAPMALPADNNMAMRGIRLFEADPSRSLYIFGNPGPVGSRANIPGVGASLAAARGRFGQTVAPSLLQLHKDKVHRVETVGVSFGAELAAAAARMMIRHCESVKPERSVLIEAVSPGRTSVKELFLDFNRSGAKLDEYVAQAEDTPLHEARDMDAPWLKKQVGFAMYLGGLLRVSNLANSRGLTKEAFAHDLQMSLEGKQSYRATVIRGTESELALQNPYQELQTKLRGHYGRRVRFLEMFGMHHAGADDINLHAAMVLQGLREARPPKQS